MIRSHNNSEKALIKAKKGLIRIVSNLYFILVLNSMTLLIMMRKVFIFTDITIKQ